MAPIFEVKTSQTQTIKTIVETLYNLVTDYSIIITPPVIQDEDIETEDGERVGGISIKEMNKSETVLVLCKLFADKFEHYEYNYHESKFIIGINSGNLLKYMKCMTNIDTLTWRVDEDDTNKLIMILESDREKKTLKINLMELYYEDRNIKKIKPTYLASMESQGLQKYCKDFNNIPYEKINILCNDKNVIFSAKNESGEAEFIVPELKDGLRIHKVDKDGDDIVQGIYELKYLLYFTKCISLSEGINIYLKNKKPIIFEYPIALNSAISDDNGNFGELKLVLAACKPDNLY
jgi:proliferating cell nuclear antigen PCNA